mmetsp:Transcript_7731/g.18878  ORF Transcript_7731/g.18878 Transcript_7731/m.18878 type:complete len:558 (+) Transcript_7731:145-1818(+)
MVVSDPAAVARAEETTQVPFEPTSAEFCESQRIADHAVEGVLARRTEAARNGEARVSTADVSSDDVAAQFSDLDLSETGCTPEAYLAALERKGLHDELHLQSPRMLGHMSGALPPWGAPLGRLVHSLHTNVVKTETAKVATAVEREAVAWMHRAFFQRPESYYARHAHDRTVCLGHATSGGTTANLEALWLARNTALPGAERRGLVAALREGGHEDAVIVTSALAHYSVTAKACGVLGLGTDNVITAPTDARLRVDVLRMRALLERSVADKQKVLAIVAVAGSTDAGSFDDIPALAELAREYGAWLHVDAAWGGGLIFATDAERTFLRGVHLADSITVDAHKQLLTPIGFGMVLYRSERAVLATAKTAPYIIRADSHDLGRFTLEGSRPASAYFLHMNLTVLGRARLRNLMDHKLAVARALAARLEQGAEWDLVVPPEADILLFRLVPPHLALRPPASESPRPVNEAREAELDLVQQRVQEGLKQRGLAFVSRTSLVDPRVDRGGKCTVFLRAVINAQSTEADALAVLRELKLTYSQLKSGAGHATDLGEVAAPSGH